MRSMQRSNMERLRAMQASLEAAQSHAKAVDSAARAQRNVKSFPHLRAVSAVITPDHRFVEVHELGMKQAAAGS